MGRWIKMLQEKQENLQCKFSEIPLYNYKVMRWQTKYFKKKTMSFLLLGIERTKRIKTKLTLLGQYGQLCFSAHWHRSP